MLDRCSDAQVARDSRFEKGEAGRGKQWGREGHLAITVLVDAEVLTASSAGITVGRHGVVAGSAGWVVVGSIWMGGSCILLFEINQHVETLHPPCS